MNAETILDFFPADLLDEGLTPKGNILTWQQRESCWSPFWHRSILDVLVLDVAGDSRGEFRQSLPETTRFPLQLLAILRQPIRIDVRFRVAIQVLSRGSFRRVLRQGEDRDPIRLVRQPLVHCRRLIHAPVI